MSTLTLFFTPWYDDFIDDMKENAGTEK